MTTKSSTYKEKSPTASTKEVKKNVKKDEEGFTYIDGIPMVDQGQKGYCVVATAGRIVRYYGLDMTQHDFAQLASSDSKNGTHIEQLMTMFKEINNKLRLKGKILFDSDIRGIIDNYNIYASKQEKPTLLQLAGAHARMISGYNLETNEIIYSDSWGKDHERKIMKMDDAWMITMGLYLFESRNRN